MGRAAALSVLALLGASILPSVNAEEISGVYLETRTCQVYTGPCFANGEVGLAGKDAIMAWSIERGETQGIDLSGLNVVMVLKASDTLGFRGIQGAGEVKSMILVDERADASQRDALVEFAKKQSGRAGEAVVRVEAAPIEMSLDLTELDGKLQAGDSVKVATRAARPGDCICSNEAAYYPPLANVEFFAPGVTLQGEFTGRGLGSRWSTPGDRSAYMATFIY